VRAAADPAPGPHHPAPALQTVYRGRWANTNVAIVCMRKGGSVTEARMMQELSGHPNLVQFYRWVPGKRGLVGGRGALTGAAA
jgi:hypothetical protein